MDALMAPVSIYLLAVRVLLLAERLRRIGIELAEIGSYGVRDYLSGGMTPQELGIGL